MPDRPDLGVLILSYCQLHILELMCQGHSRNQAAELVYRLYGNHLVHMASNRADCRMVDRADLRRDRYLRYWCLAKSAAHNAEELRRGGIPRELLSASHLDAACWLLETVRRVASGSELLAAARAAHDGFLHRPRQRRRPVEADWLTEQVTAALEGVWSAVARTPAGWGIRQRPLAWGLGLGEAPPWGAGRPVGSP
jgi:hypothetical protein